MNWLIFQSVISQEIVKNPHHNPLNKSLSQNHLFLFHFKHRKAENPALCEAGKKSMCGRFAFVNKWNDKAISCRIVSYTRLIVVNPFHEEGNSKTQSLHIYLGCLHIQYVHLFIKHWGLHTD